MEHSIYLGTCLKNQNAIQEEIKSRLKSKNTCFHWVKCFFLQSANKNINIEICKNIILPVVLCGYETWSVTLREERMLRVFDNRVLRRIFELKRDEVTREWKILQNE